MSLLVTAEMLDMDSYVGMPSAEDTAMRECLFCELPIPVEQSPDEPYCDKACADAHVDTALTGTEALSPLCSCHGGMQVHFVGSFVRDNGDGTFTWCLTYRSWDTGKESNRYIEIRQEGLMRKLTMVSIQYRGIKRAVFVNLPVDSNGHVRADYNEVMKATGISAPYGSTFSIG